MKMQLFLLRYTLILLSYTFANAKSDNSTEPSFVPKPTDILRPQPRILGGRDAAEGQFPYQISLRVRGSHICGGSIVSRSYVVTAAHCVITNLFDASPEFLTILAGTNLLNSGGVIVGISAVIPHPGYRLSTEYIYNNDIALLRLSTPLNFNNQIRAIPLATIETPSGAAVVISGWGRTSRGGSIPNRLQFHTLYAVDNAECQRLGGGDRNSILCLAHSSGNGICSGDSGSPAAYNGRLVGVANYQINGCGSTAPDGYAKVNLYADWIRQNSDL